MQRSLASYACHQPIKDLETDRRWAGVVMGFCCLRQALLVDVSAVWCRAELVELGAASSAAAAPA